MRVWGCMYVIIYVRVCVCKKKEIIKKEKKKQAGLGPCILLLGWVWLAGRQAGC
ncbi:hypothetical protein Hanom_Chr12g01067631 [Helianthus anomalus]